MKLTIGELAELLLDGGFFMEEEVELLEKGMIAGALQRTGGNQCEASKILGIHRNTLQRKMTEFRIDGRRRKPVTHAGALKGRRVKTGTAE